MSWSPRRSWRSATAVLGVLGLLTILTVTGVLTVPGAAAHPTQGRAADPASAAPLVLIGTAGLRWDDISDQTPSLGALLAGGSAGSVVARSVQLTACPVDGWLAVSAGRRADDERGAGCRPPTVSAPVPGGAGTVQRWSVYRSRAAGGGAGAVPGTLGDLLAQGNRTAAAIGPGAALALATSGGVAAHVWPGLPAAADGSVDAAQQAAGLGEQLTAALALAPELLVIDVGAVRDDRTLGLGPGQTPDPAADRADQVRAIDDRLGLLFGALPESSTMLLASLADSGDEPHLQLAGAIGPVRSTSGTYRPALLRSGSTRQDGLVLATDVLPTLARGLGLAVPSTVDGATITGGGRGGTEVDRLERMLDLDQGATALQRVVVGFFVIVLPVEALALLLLGLLLGRSAGARSAGARSAGAPWLVQPVAVLGAAVPAATVLSGLWPWWRADHPLLTLLGAVLLFAVPLAAVALLGPWRRTILGPAGAIGGLTALVLTADAATGSRLLLITPMGGQPLIGGRFFGFSNPVFAVFGTGALFAALALGQALLDRGRRREAVAAVAVIGAVATLIDVLPGLGADLGGPPALVPAFAVLGLRIAGLRVTRLRAAVILGGTAALLVAICVADWLRPADQRTHLGRFVQTVLDGGAADVVRRKAEQNLSILTSSPLTMLLPVGAVLVVWALARPARWRLGGVEVAYRRVPVLRPGLVALGVLAGLGFALNDSGTSIPPAAMTLAVPCLVAVCARAVQVSQAEELGAAVERVRRHPDRT